LLASVLHHKIADQGYQRRKQNSVESGLIHVIIGLGCKVPKNKPPAVLNVQLKSGRWRLFSQVRGRLIVCPVQGQAVFPVWLFPWPAWWFP
jgi:hypothetical protein